MNRTIKVNRIEIRRTVHDACHELITDSDIAEKVYMKVMDNLEDYLSDCEDETDEEWYDWRDEQEYEDRWERRADETQP